MMGRIFFSPLSLNGSFSTQIIFVGRNSPLTLVFFGFLIMVSYWPGHPTFIPACTRTVSDSPKYLYYAYIVGRCMLAAFEHNYYVYWSLGLKICIPLKVVITNPNHNPYTLHTNLNQYLEYKCSISL